MLGTLDVNSVLKDIEKPPALNTSKSGDEQINFKEPCEGRAERHVLHNRFRLTGMSRHCSQRIATHPPETHAVSFFVLGINQCMQSQFWRRAIFFCSYSFGTREN